MERTIKINIGLGYMINNSLQQDAQVVVDGVHGQSRTALYGGAIDHREVELGIICTKLVKQLKNFTHYPVRTGAVAVDLVDHDNGVETVGKRLHGHKPSLGHGAVDSVNHQQYRVHHGQDTLDLTAEVGVPRGINNIDAVFVPVNGGVFGQNRDATFLLQIIGVHQPFGLLVATVQGAGLLQ